MNKKQLIIFWTMIVLFNSLAYAESKTDYFPLTEGNYWIYQDQIEIQDANGEFEVENKYIGEKVKVRRINQLRTLKVLSTETRGDFKIAKMQEEDFNGVTRLFYLVDNKNGEIYRYTEEEIKEVLTDDGKVNLSGVPEYVFPLQKDSKWGDAESLNRKDRMYFLYVEKIEDVIVPAGTFKNCFKIAYRTLPDDTQEWFCPSVGIVRMEYHHHGTITDHISELKETNLK